MSDDIEDEAPEPTELVIEIEPAVRYKGADYSTLSLREPLATEVQQAEALIGNVATIQSMRRYQMMLVSKVSTWPLGALDQLPIRKLDEAGDFVAGFTNGGRKTGKR